jgi:putative transposase
MRDSKRSSTRVCAERDAPIAELQTMSDHVHLLVVHVLVMVHPQYDIHRLVRQIKPRSSRLLREEYPDLRSKLPTLWTSPYFDATAGGTTPEVIKRYVENQHNV